MINENKVLLQSLRAITAGVPDAALTHLHTKATPVRYFVYPITAIAVRTAAIYVQGAVNSGTLSDYPEIPQEQGDDRTKAQQTRLRMLLQRMSIHEASDNQLVEELAALFENTPAKHLLKNLTAAVRISS